MADRILKALRRYAGEFVLGMAVMGAVWLLLGAALVAVWPLLTPTVVERARIRRRIETPVEVSRPTWAQASTLIEVSSVEVSPPVTVKTATSGNPPPTPPLLSLAEASGLAQPQPSPAAQVSASEPTGPVSPLVGWPVDGEISNPFGCTVYYSGRPGPGCPATAPWFHDGLDIAAPAGRPVQAALSGTVIFAGADGSGPACGDYRGYGLGVVVDTGLGWQALYAHLSRVDVVAGQTVTPDTFIGAVGETGCVSGPHLHFGLRYGADLVDPQSWKGE